MQSQTGLVTKHSFQVGGLRAFPLKTGPTAIAAATFSTLPSLPLQPLRPYCLCSRRWVEGLGSEQATFSKPKKVGGLFLVRPALTAIAAATFSTPAITAFAAATALSALAAAVGLKA